MPRLTKEQDLARIREMFAFDVAQAGREGAVILGMDEVGRGPVAGPLATGGVVFHAGSFVEILNDSKKLSEKKREAAKDMIESVAAFTHVEFVDAVTIDEIGIVPSLIKAFKAQITACEEAGIVPDLILLDGNPLDVDSRVKTVVKGDAQSASIAAASIVAKVTRDHLMAELAKQYPQYGWDSNKGYGSAAHMQAIRDFGMSPYHRRSFLKNLA